MLFSNIILKNGLRGPIGNPGFMLSYKCEDKERDICQEIASKHEITGDLSYFI